MKEVLPEQCYPEGRAGGTCLALCDALRAFRGSLLLLLTGRLEGSVLREPLREGVDGRLGRGGGGGEGGRDGQ